MSVSKQRESVRTGWSEQATYRQKVGDGPKERRRRWAVENAAMKEAGRRRSNRIDYPPSLKSNNRRACQAYTTN